MMLKKLRLEKRMSQKKLCRKLKITQGYLSRLENRKGKYHKNVTVELILNVSEILDADEDELFRYFADSVKQEKQSNS